MEDDDVTDQRDTEVVVVEDNADDYEEYSESQQADQERDLQEWRTLRARQDEEYNESLLADQERERALQREADIRNRRREALERRRFNLSRLVEPQDGVPLHIKFPDGHVLRRRFHLMHPIQHLFDFAGSDEMATEVFFIQRTQASAIRSTTRGRIIDYITESCTLFVTWGEDQMDTNMEDTLAPGENTPQSITSGLSETAPDLPDFNHGTDTNEPDLETLLTNLMSKVCSEDIPSGNMINVCRDNVMDGAKRAFARRSFNPEAKISVVFMDDSMQAEGAVDEGGPSREFFRLLMMAIKESTLFTGPENNKNLSLDSHALHRGIYKTYGVMISVALLHGGVMPAFFSERLFKNLFSITSSSSPPTLDEITDLDLQTKLRKIFEAGDITAARAAIEECAESLSLLGSLRYIGTMEEREQLVQAATTFYVEGRTKETLEQFSDGFNTLGLLSQVKMHPNAFKQVFCTSHRKLRAEDLMSLFKAELSCPGSNRWRLEKKVEGYWRDFLVDVEDGVFEIELQQILIFASGADRIPALGFTPQPTISFIHEIGRNYPEANTCLVKLKLPIHETYENFTKYMFEGIIQSPTFGMA
ncbi:G2/M phase-specific E3 ubiquitin-protein ligase-like [Triplophysa dalaica]|uniref:G2/M phase-specific E3 ubiquitin-protein ligase-like n=1 Tax=Triplophysa dalaica TaxID=1582913 RepID=UPI0024DFDBA4|nr:G2/M phase-specific E3 ubiquitin-protein ligase-like [Triplophysa dalaica]